MDQSRYLIIGAHGQLGKALRLKYPQAHVVGRDELDIADELMISNYGWGRFDVIINAAAYTNVDGAETSEGRQAAWQTNASGPGYLSSVAVKHNLALIHVSSEYVFDGSISPHFEDEAFTPLGVYAQSKAAGDIAVSVTPKHYILRTSWLIGDGPNFVRTMESLSQKNISPNVVADQTGRLTFTSTIVNAIDHLLKVRAPYGVYNISNDGKVTSWSGVARKIYELCGHSGNEVSDTSTEEYFLNKPSSAPRPLKSELDLTKIKSTGFTPTDWQQELENYLKVGVG